MQEADRKLAWSGLFVLAVIAVELAWFVITGPADHRASAAANQETDYWPPWRWLTYSAFWSAIFAGVLTWSTIGLWRQTRKLAVGADEQARLTREMFVAEHRPWVECEPTGDGTITWSEESAEFEIPFSLINVGRTPALEVCVIIRPVVDMFRPVTAEPLRRWAESIEDFGSGETLSSDGIVVRKTATVFKSHIEEWQRKYRKQSDEDVDWFTTKFMVCVRYNTRLADKPLYTGFVASVNYMIVSQGYSEQLKICPAGTVVSIRVARSSFGSFVT